MTAKECVVKRIKRICTDRNISMYELSRISGVSYSTLYSAVNSKQKDISIRTVIRLCDGIGMSMVDFFDSPEFDSLK